MAKKTLVIKTKYGSFKCTFEPEKDMGGYVVEAHGIQGPVSWGKNLNEAKKMIAEAIEGVVEAEAIAQAVKAGIVRFTVKNKLSYS